MLKHLDISKYALIEHLSIDFSKGFSVITGETGAGKSIILGALNLVLGQRADVKSIAKNAKKCVVEAVFDLRAYHFETLFKSLELDYDPEECILRREVSSTGKSRAFINDTPVKLNALRELASKLIDIHSQHAGLLLGEREFQLEVLDTIADTKALQQTYTDAYTHFRHTDKALKSFVQQVKQEREELDFARFQFAQLSEANLNIEEQSVLESELSTLNHTEEIKTALQTTLQLLQDEDEGILSSLHGASSSLMKVSDFMSALPTLQERLESVTIELEDVASELEDLFQDSEYDPNRKQEVEDRLNVIYGLESKHHVDTVEALLELQDKYEALMNRISGFDDELKAKTLLNEKAKKCTLEAAKALHNQRLTVQEVLARQLEDKLHSLGMQNAKLHIDITWLDHYLPSGCDQVVFRFTANKNLPLQPIADIASGGEMARVMLSLKAMLASRTDMPTLLFDEIDTGVSGDVAQKMGVMMSQMSRHLQILAITHLPQVAAIGNQHYKVYKEDTADKTESFLVRLTEEQRVLELAEILSGKPPTSAAKNNAQELIETMQQAAKNLGQNSRKN